ncbi:hypothetical protein GIB67_042141 [Kingdonia uniflora]|uniref:DUF7054 domain-containing protein n=1 Tax=Kingdonia uniflora TaxID=39325 RepID=A0A7J7NPD5_9MAGN|nr:hypothetical protein GIB67_042141 [Kingdonia uniflora]
MSRQSLLQKKIPSNRCKPRPPYPSPSPRQRQTLVPHRSEPRNRYKVLRRFNSEPILWTVGLLYSDSKSDIGVLVQGQTCPDIFALTSPYMSSSPSNHERYNKDAKVVVNVTVEGSPGPVRALVRLGASVEETIKRVVEKYIKEGRRPLIDGKFVPSFELHHSYFSLEGINKTEEIGDVGTRSFYLRKGHTSSRSGHSIINDDGSLKLISSYDEEVMVVPVRATHPLVSSRVIFSAGIAQKIHFVNKRPEDLPGRAKELAKLEDYVFMHVYRECNGVADALADYLQDISEMEIEPE